MDRQPPSARQGHCRLPILAELIGRVESCRAAARSATAAAHLGYNGRVGWWRAGACRWERPTIVGNLPLQDSTVLAGHTLRRPWCTELLNAGDRRTGAP